MPPVQCQVYCVFIRASARCVDNVRVVLLLKHNGIRGALITYAIIVVATKCIRGALITDALIVVATKFNWAYVLDTLGIVGDILTSPACIIIPIVKPLMQAAP